MKTFKVVQYDACGEPVGATVEAERFVIEGNNAVFLDTRDHEQTAYFANVVSVTTVAPGPGVPQVDVPVQAGG